MKTTFKKALTWVLLASMLVMYVLAAPSAVTVADTKSEPAAAEKNTAVLLDISGEGTEEDPFMIETEEDLRLISDFNDCYFKLANDIVLTDTNWEPLCVLTTPFSGTFDGDGHTIFGLAVRSNRSAENYYNGLFSRNAGTIKNLNVVTSESGITGYSVNVGVLVGHNSGTIENCRVSGTINLNNTSSSWTVNMGGLAGTNNSKGVVERCYSDVSIYSDASTTDNGYKYVGGLVGYNYGSISKSFFDGSLDLGGYNVNYPNYYVGGLVGHGSGSTSKKTTITDCAAVTTILNTDGMGYFYTVSGLIGYGGSYSSVSNSYAVVNGTQLDYGLAYSATVTNSFYDKDVSGKTDTGRGEPKTTAAMKMKATYTRAGWDFDNTWGISKEINGGYPYLLWMYDEESADAETSFSTSMQAFLNLKGIISMSVGYKFNDMTSINPEEYVNRVGLLVWKAENAPEEAQATFENCTNVIKGAKYNSALGRFETTTEGIVAKELGDLVTFRPYFVNEDGSYTYGRLITDYSPKTYCYNQIRDNADDDKLIGLMASILNYGAAAQVYYGYNTDNLMNSDLPEELK